MDSGSSIVSPPSPCSSDWLRSHDPWRIVVCVIYATTLVLLYASFTLYHAFRTPRVKNVFQIFDYSAIYLLISGTYMPFTLVNLRGPWGFALFAVIWTLGIVCTAASLYLLPVEVHHSCC